MNSRDISAAMRDRLKTLSGRPDTHWPNVDADPAQVPRFEVVFSSRQREDTSLKGGQIDREVGTMRIIICTEHGLGENAGLDYLDDIRALFPKGQAISVTGGAIRITAAPTADATPFPDDTVYRLPVAIQYVATAT